MKKALIRFHLLSLLFLLSTVSAFAQQTEFNRATDLLEQQEYREAIDQYLQITDQRYESGALWYNLGIAYSQLDSLGMAKYYFLKSSGHPETKADADKAVQFINEQFSRRSAVLPPLPWERFFFFLNNRIGTTLLNVFGFIFLYTAVGAILLSWYFKKNSSLFRYSTYTSFGLSLILFASAFYVSYLNSRYNTGVVVDRQSQVYQSPDSNSAEISRAYEGYTLRVDNHESEGADGWIYIRLENGMHGWIDKSSVRVI